MWWRLCRWLALCICTAVWSSRAGSDGSCSHGGRTDVSNWEFLIGTLVSTRRLAKLHCYICHLNVTMPVWTTVEGNGYLWCPAVCSTLHEAENYSQALASPSEIWGLMKLFFGQGSVLWTKMQSISPLPETQQLIFVLLYHLQKCNFQINKKEFTMNWYI